MRKLINFVSPLLSGILLSALGTSGSSIFAQQLSSAGSPAGRSSTVDQVGYGKIPLSFEANHGQADEAALFLAHGDGYSLFFTPTSATIALRGKDKSADVLRMELAGQSSATKPEGVDKLSGVASYFIGNDPSQWHTGIETYGKVKYAGVYPGIDLVYYGNQRALEYDFVVSPNADAGQIRVSFDGAQQLGLAASGDLSVVASNGKVNFLKPVVYQNYGGRRHTVDASYRLVDGKTIAFQLGKYDRNRELVIDPTLAYSTYLGGTGGDAGIAIAVDASGSAYITGSTGSTNFPLSGAVQSTNRAASAGGLNVFVTKLNPTGNGLVYSTYLGGTTNDQGAGIAVDGSGQAYITGRSDSLDYPTTAGAFQTKNNTGQAFAPNAFLTKLDTGGTGIVYSTYLGGSNFDYGTALAVDSNHHAYLTGFAGSVNFPVTSGAYETTGSGAAVFVTEFNGTGTGLIYSTYISGGSDDHSMGIAVNSALEATVVGWTESTSFPVTSGAFQTTNKSGGATGFVTELNSAGSALVHSTYLGGTTSGDEVLAVALDSSGNTYVSGVAASTNFPVVNGSYKTVNPSGHSSGFVTKLNSGATGLVYSTYLGGTDSVRDHVNAIAVNAAGDAVVTGVAYSSNFPTTSGAFQTTNKGLGNSTSNAFMTELNAAGSGLLYSTYLGGTGNSASNGDQGNGIAVDANGNAYLTGTAYSTNFPFLSGYQSTNKSSSTGTAFVTKFSFPQAAVATPVFSPAAGTYSTAQSVTITDSTSGATIYYTTNGSTPTTLSTKYTGAITVSATETIKAIAVVSGSAQSAVASATYTIVANTATPVFSPAAGTYTAATLVTITDATSGATIYYTTNGSTPTTASTKYTGPVVVTASETIKAIAVASGHGNSAVASAAYVIIGSPTALAYPATAITTTGATLNGIINPEGIAGKAYFLYGTSITLNSITSETTVGASTSPSLVSTKLTTLTTKTKYYYQVVVITAGGTATGEILSFTTN